MDEAGVQSADEEYIVEVDGVGLETHFYHSTQGVTAPTMVFLHEGLGSVAMWREFPGRIVSATGLPAVVYSRCGYGKSDPRVKAYDANFMHREALNVLPGLLKSLQVIEPILIGHSDGGTIALIYASEHPVTGVVVEAPHIFVEDICVKAIARLWRAREDMNLVAKLGRYHNDPEAVFEGWKDIWLDPAFRDWNIFDQVMGITCPILAIQGELDEYGSMAQIEGIASNALGSVTLSKLSRCGHSPHRDKTELVIQEIARFIKWIRGRYA